MKRLNFGCGPIVPNGWTNFDLVDYGVNDHGDFVDGLPYDDATFDGIVAHHVIQAIHPREIPRVLGELRRVLVDGAVLRVTVPDVVAAVEAYLRDDPGWPGFVAIAEPYDLDEKLSRYLTWSGTNLATFTPDYLCALLDRAEFADVGVPMPQTTAGPSWLLDLDSRLGESIVVEAIA